MRSRAAVPVARALMHAAAVAVILAAAAGAPSMAAHHEDYKGWFVSLDAASTQPNGLDQQYANFTNPSTGYTVRKTMENDADFTWALKVGYSWGELGGLSVSYWSFDNEDTEKGSDSVNYVYPTVFGAYGYNNGGAYGLYPPSDYKATAKTKASTIDLDYYRPMHAGEKMTVKWIAGLRSATFEEDRNFDGTDTYGYYYTQNHHMKSDAFGVKLGAKVIFGFTDHFSLQGLMAYSLMQAKTDADATQNASGTIDKITASDDKVRGEIRDYDLRGVWTYDMFDFYVGYGGQTWDGLVADPINGSCCGASGAARATRDSIAFNSVHAGVTFRFGKK